MSDGRRTRISIFVWICVVCVVVPSSFSVIPTLRFLTSLIDEGVLGLDWD